MKNTQEKEPNPQETMPSISLQKLYLKDLSFESPRPVEAFSSPVEHPEIELDINTTVQKLDESSYEILLHITVTAQTRESKKVLYLVEAKQAGLFNLNNLNNDQINAALNGFCPDMLLPYAREVVSRTIERGGFPQLLISPINFNMLYKKHTAKHSVKAEA